MNLNQYVFCENSFVVVYGHIVAIKAIRDNKTLYESWLTGKIDDSTITDTRKVLMDIYKLDSTSVFQGSEILDLLTLRGIQFTHAILKILHSVVS
jgi:hypothetical protein